MKRVQLQHNPEQAHFKVHLRVSNVRKNITKEVMIAVNDCSLVYNFVLIIPKRLWLRWEVLGLAYMV